MLNRVKASFPARFGAAYGESQAGNYGAALAFSVFLAMFPLILGILAILGLVVHDPTMLAKVQRLIVDVFPGDAHPQLLKALEGTKQSAGVMGVISIAGLIWTGTGLFAAMEFALTEVFGTNTTAT
jgi:membrane protein